MRRVLIDHARRRNAHKRGGQTIRVPLQHAENPAPPIRPGVRP
jgi:hypothetical protein